MASNWADWEQPGSNDPYVEWWTRVEHKRDQTAGGEFSFVPILGNIDFSLFRFLPFLNAAYFSGSSLQALTRSGKTEILSPSITDPSLSGISAKTALPLPIPEFAKRPDSIEPGEASRVAPGGSDPDKYAQLPLPEKLFGPGSDGKGGLPDDTIIVGVIDSDIPLGHTRFRERDGKSRILAAWQMMAQWGEPGGLSQAYLPFGRELYKDDIDALMLEHSGGSYDSWLDEEAFNAATGVLDKRNIGGRRGIAKRFSHGAHVLDLAAGADPVDEPEFARRVKIVAINIPDSSNFGAAGTFLDEYLRYAILRVTDLADALWLRNHPWAKAGDRVGYPVVLNISFGKQAGAKSNLDNLPAFITKLLASRDRTLSSSVRVIMPAGNDNHLQCNAFLEPCAGDTVALNWRVMPEDRSSNFVEIWVDGEEGEDVPPISVSLTPPGAQLTIHAPVVGEVGKVRRLRNSLGDVAAIHCERVPQTGTAGQHHFRYVLGMAPTYHSNDKVKIATAVAGVWTIQIRNDSNRRVQCRLSVQTDQQVSSGSPGNVRSYFDHCAYRRYDEMGRLVESENYPATDCGIGPDLIGNSPVRRHGTMNSSASNEAVARIGGYRLTDGKPAHYSATGRGRRRGIDDGTELGHNMFEGASGAPTAALPTDDGAAHFGVLAAGSANGSTVAMRGTSFASAQATRCVVNDLLDRGDNGKSAKEILTIQADIAERDPSGNPFAAGYPGKADIDQVGKGRIPSPVRSRVDRMGGHS